MDDLIIEFITETNEALGELDNDLLRLEQNPNDKDLISKIFRLMHTIKGTCGFLGLPRLETVAHRAENVMGRFRAGDLLVTGQYVTLILQSLDRVRMLLGHIETTGTEPEGSDDDLIEQLDAVYEGRDLPATAQTSPAPEMQASAPAVEPPELVLPDKPFDEYTIADLDALFEDKSSAGKIASVPETKQAEPEHAEPVEQQVFERRASDVAKAPQQTQTNAASKSEDSANGNQTLRVNVDVLENLMTMVSELVLTRNQLMQMTRKQSEVELATPMQRLNQVVSSLQDGIMKTRMQPIGNAWAKLPRIIRDLSLELGKKIDLVMIGQETELDRQVLEMIKDPLTHMVRNSGDHGIETPDLRRAAGKPDLGTITLKAFHEGGYIIIQIVDDGKGLPMDKIRKKILSNKLATEDELATMSDQTIQQYIFRAGFSTADQITSVSGRGVGMDVVRTNIEKIGGSIDLNSVEGKGSTFTIKIPLTLAIVSSLIVESAQERFAIPQLAVNELVLVSDKSEHKIETINGTPVLRLRNKLLPLVSLERLLKLEQPDITALPKHQYIIVTQVGNNRFGVIVDNVFDTEEIVVKPVSKFIKSIEFFSGNTILGDGSVIMILDPNGIAKNIGITESDYLNDDSVNRDTRSLTSLLLFRAGQKTALKAIPLSEISRLENIELGRVEFTSGQMMLQYRGELMRVMPIDDQVDMNGKFKPLLVFETDDQYLGIIVDEIVDIQTTYIDLQHGTSSPGVLGSLILNGTATELVDVDYLNAINGYPAGSGAGSLKSLEGAY